jgi:aspartate/methionine/tyrosine aminotransferase
MKYARMPIEIESPEELGYGSIRYNLAESSTADRSLADLRVTLDPAALVLQYGDHRGHSGLRELLAAESGCRPSQVLLTPGAAGALFIAATALLERGDHLIVLRPNYATNLETPRAIGCEISCLDLSFDNGWRYGARDIEALIRPATRLISLTTPHNPTGTVLPAAELKRIVALAESRGIWLLVDETYRDLQVADPAPFATIHSDRVISVASLSKAYGLPGLRLGWLLTQNPGLAERFLAAKEQMVLCGPIIEEEIGFQVYRRRTELRPEIATLVAERIGVVARWLAGHPAVEWVEPEGGVVCFPRIKPGLRFEPDRFYRGLTEDHGTYVGAGHWFEQDRRYFRLGFGWPTAPELEAGLAGIDRALEPLIFGLRP